MFYGQLPVEAPPKLDTDPDATWPSKGDITFEKVQLKYRPELPPVLKGLSFHISPGEKVRGLANCPQIINSSSLGLRLALSVEQVGYTAFWVWLLFFVDIGSVRMHRCR